MMAGVALGLDSCIAVEAREIKMLIQEVEKAFDFAGLVQSDFAKVLLDDFDARQRVLLRDEEGNT